MTEPLSKSEALSAAKAVTIGGFGGMFRAVRKSRGWRAPDNGRLESGCSEELDRLIKAAIGDFWGRSETQIAAKLEAYAKGKA